MSEKTPEQIRDELAKFNQVNSVLDIILKSSLPLPNKSNCGLEEETDLLSQWEAVRRQYGGVSNIPSSQLGVWLDRFNSALSFAYYTEAVADYESLCSKTQREFAKEKLFLIQPTCSNRDTQAALVHNEPLYMSLTERHLVEYGKWRILSALVKGYEKQAEAISREITRRGQDLDSTIRSHNVSNIPDKTSKF